MRITSLLKLALLALPLGVAPATAESFPDKPITIVVGTSAGGGADTFARKVAEFAPKHLGVEAVVVNKPGGGGQVALNDFIANDPADGYTMFTALIPHIIYWSETRPDGQRGFTLDQLKHIAQPVRIPAGFMVKADSDFESWDDVVAAAKASPDKVTIGMNGERSGGHGLVLQIEQAADIQLAEVAYGGGSKQVKGVLGDEVQILNTNAMHAFRRPDELRPIAFAGEERFSLVPDAPTFKELGIDVVDFVTRGFVVPEGTPEDRAQVLRDGVREIANDPAFQEEMAELGLPVDYMDHVATEAYIDNFLSDKANVLETFNNGS